MAASHEFFVVQSQNRIVAVQEVWVEDDLDPVRSVVEQLDATNLIQDRIISVVRHVVGDHWGERVPLERKDPTLQENLVFF